MAAEITTLGYDRASVVILGASGFIGRWLARHAGRLGAKLVLVVRDAARSAEIFDELEIVGEMIEADLVADQGVERVLRGLAPSITFNCVAYGVDPLEHDERMAYRVNVELVERMVRGSVSTPSRDWVGQQIVHLGSGFEQVAVAAANGAASSIPLYARSKLAGTQIFGQCCRELGVRGLTTRLFSVYGPGEHAGRLLPALIEAAQRREPLALTEGTQQRDFTYVEDVVEGLLRLGASQARPGEVVDLASGRLTPVRDFARTAAEVLGLPEENLCFGDLPRRAEEMRPAEVSLERLAALTAWRPTTEIVAGITRTEAIGRQLGAPERR